jgi:hypothetical protein
MFATAVLAGHPVEAIASQTADSITLKMSVWLPRSEYRAVSVFSTDYARVAGASVWTIPNRHGLAVTELLHKRLGIAIREMGGE